jgi:prophage regulatory protein
VAKPKTPVVMQQAPGRPADFDTGFPVAQHYRVQHRTRRAADSAGDNDTPRLEKFLPLGAVIEATGLAKPTIYRAMAEGRFPKQIKLEAKPGAKRSVSVWLLSEIANWQQQQIHRRDEGRAAPPEKARSSRKEKNYGHQDRRIERAGPAY